MIVLIAEMKVKPGYENILADGCMKMAETVRENEEGCMMYTPYVSLADPAEMIMVEKYADEQALEFHTQTPYYKEGMNKLKEILAAPMEVERYNEEPTMMVT